MDGDFRRRPKNKALVPGSVAIETGFATPRTPVSCTIELRGHTLVQDKPPESGGNDEGPMASELLLAGLLSCQLSTFAKVAKKRGSEAVVKRITGHVHFDDKDDIERVVVEWEIAGADAKDQATLTRLTDRICTISRALKVPVDVA